MLWTAHVKTEGIGLLPFLFSLLRATSLLFEWSNIFNRKDSKADVADSRNSG